MKLNRLFLLFLLLYVCEFASAATALREINLEWEPIENAKSYEIQIESKTTSNLPNTKESKLKTGADKIKSFTVKEPAWTGRLSPGAYLMKLRSRDYRQVPGEWSNTSEFSVSLEPIQIKFPKAFAQISSKKNDNEQIKFQWTAPAGAIEFEAILLDENNQELKSIKTKDTFWSLEIPVGANYKFKVKAKDLDGNETEGFSLVDFKIFGPKLDTPNIERPESVYVRELKWSASEKSERFTYLISRQDPTTKKFFKLIEVNDHTSTSADFDPSWPGGTYKISVKARAKNRPSSDVASRVFEVVDGSRSPASEYNALVKKSIDHSNGWYAIASYLVTQINYSNDYQDSNTKLTYSAVGGTGRIGAGYLSETTPWGFLGILDLSGYTVSKSNVTFASLEASMIYRKNVGTRSEFRFFSGAYYKELPATIGDSFASTTENKNVAVVGPQAGLEYWYSISPKIGFQLNLHGYVPLLKITTPNDKSIVPSLSYQAGLLGSYRVNQNFTGLIGVARRNDNIKYGAGAPLFGTATSDTNQVDVVGTYFNLLAEYDF